MVPRTVVPVIRKIGPKKTPQIATAAVMAPEKPSPGSTSSPLVTPEAPSSAPETYHQRKMVGRGPSSMVAARALPLEPVPRSEAGRHLSDHLQHVMGIGAGNQPQAAHNLLDALGDHLANEPSRMNRTSDLHETLDAIPLAERIPLLQRSIRALRKAMKDGALPAEDKAELDALAKTSQLVVTCLDLDDNVLYLDTKLTLFHRDDGSERVMSTGDFAVTRKQIGQPGEWERWEVRGDDQIDGSYKNMRDLGDPGIFPRDLMDAMSRPEAHAPSLGAFLYGTSLPQLAAWTYIITARGHFPRTMKAGFEQTKEAGYNRHNLPLENFFAVSEPGLAERLAGTVESPSEAKVKVLENILDAADAVGFGPSALPVIGPDGGKKKEYRHLLRFSDDDLGTFETVVKALGDEVKKGRWPNMKISVDFTGVKHPEVKPHTVVLKSDGTPRRPVHAEILEPDRLRDRIAAHQKVLDGQAS